MVLGKIQHSVPFEYEAMSEKWFDQMRKFGSSKKDLFRNHYGTPVNTEEPLGKLFRMKTKNS